MCRLIRAAAPRRGLTLIELLVAVTILLMVTVVALPVMMPTKEGRRIRDAARSINVLLGSARSHALETGRPSGVWFQRMKGLPRCSNVMYLAEVPPLYAGELVTSTAVLRYDTSSLGSGPTTGLPGFTVSQGSPGDIWIQSNIRPGDLIQFNNQGPEYIVTFTNASELASDGSIAAPNPNTATFRVALDTSRFPKQRTPLLDSSATGVSSPPMSFKIWRQPVPLINSAVQMPPGVAVDLQYSGVDSLLTQLTSTSDELGTFDQNAALVGDTYRDLREKPVVILFSPSGVVESVYCWWTVNTGSGSQKAYLPGKTLEPIYLLVGRQDRVRALESTPFPPSGTLPAPEDRPNWLSPDSLWISIAPRTGLIRTGEIVLPADNLPVSNCNWASRRTWRTPVASLGRQYGPLYNSRDFARVAEGMGGQ